MSDNKQDSTSFKVADDSSEDQNATNQAVAANRTQENQNDMAQDQVHAKSDPHDNLNTIIQANTPNDTQDSLNTMSQVHTANETENSQNATTQACYDSQTTDCITKEPLRDLEISLHDPDISATDTIDRKEEDLVDKPIEHKIKEHTCNARCLLRCDVWLKRFKVSKTNGKLKGHSKHTRKLFKAMCGTGVFGIDDTSDESAPETTRCDAKSETKKQSKVKLKTKEEELDVKQERKVVEKREVDLEPVDESKQPESDKIFESETMNSESHSLGQSLNENT